MLTRRATTLSSNAGRTITSRAFSASVIPSYAAHKRGASGAAALNGRDEIAEDERDIFLSVLSASTTKRDAKSYISRFSPKGLTSEGTSIPLSHHVALIKIRALESLDDVTIQGLVRTFSQLSRLGLGCIIVVEPGRNAADSTRDDTKLQFRHTAWDQAQRMVSALEKAKTVKARRLDEVLSVAQSSDQLSASVQVRGRVEVQYPDLLSRCLATGTIPVIAPVAFTEDTQRVTDIDADDAALAIVRELAGVRRQSSISQSLLKSNNVSNAGIDPLPVKHILDRIIVLDPLGAIPSTKRLDNAHIFLNMEQEYEDTRDELVNERKSDQSSSAPQHLRNLDLLRNTLALLPPSSSALLATPWQAATLPRQEIEDESLGVQTRRPKNPLIFNLLTDKPLISSSLPTGRMMAEGRQSVMKPPSRATFAKRGMPLTMIPNPKTSPWCPPLSHEYHMSLEDPRIDFPRLLNLIEDSFNRPLDVPHYLERIRNRIAGVIVAGEYEGGAILTWELPPGVPDDDSEASRRRMVPYLDKFAVLKRSQGAGGVADIVFSAMVRTCFPNGVCWRSRRDNPVNKWYFERSVGTWKIRDSNWAMFWTDQGLEKDSQRWRDYEAVCRTVVPSWADNKSKLD